MHVPDVNLMPSSRRQRSWRRWPHAERLTWLLLIAGWLLLALMVALSVQNRRALRALEVQVSEARLEAQQAERLLAQREERVNTIAQLLRRANRLEAERAELQRRPFSLSELLVAIEEAAPPRLAVRAVRVSGERVTVEGVAGSPALVVEFTRALEDRAVASRVVVERVESRDEPTWPSAVDFVLILER